MKLFWCTLLLLIGYSSSGQYVISGKVSDTGFKPLIFATVTVSNGGVVLEKTVTDSLGNFSFLKKLPVNIYDFSFSHVACITTSFKLYVDKDSVLNQILKPIERKLKDVIVTASQPIFERKNDRFVYNIGNQKGGKGGNAWDILAQTPLVATNENGGIGISGTEGARVYVNSRKVYFSGQALMNYLKNISSESVQQIEVITVPSSKYEADGGAGIINYVLKKNKADGIMGDITVSNRQGTFNSQTLNSSINFREKNINLFATINTSNQNKRFTGHYILEYLKNSKIYYENENKIKRDLKSKFDVMPTFGMDIMLSKRTTIGFLIDFSNSSLRRYNTTNTNFINPELIVPDSSYETKSFNDEHVNYVNGNINLQHQIDTSGGLLTFSADYLYYNEIRNSVQSTVITSPTLSPAYVRDYFISTLPQNVTNKAFLVDYSKPLGKRLVLEVGLRYADSYTSNDVRFKIQDNTQHLIVDTTRSNYFNYTERIFSGYGQVKEKINEKWDFQAGLRIENTYTVGELVTKKQKYINRYTNLFPSIFINYTPNKDHQFSLVYTERINRPSFWDINPFRYYTSMHIYMTGNPFLTPSKVVKGEFAYVLKNKWIFQLFHSRTIDAFASLTYADSLETFDKQTNYGTKEATGFNLSYSNRIKPYWFLRVSSNISYVRFKGQYGNTIINHASSFPLISMLNAFTISKAQRIYATVNTSNIFEHYSTNVIVKNQFVANVGLTKTSKNSKVQFGLNVTDVFRTGTDRYVIEQRQLNNTQEYYFDNLGILFSVKYGFGNLSFQRSRKNIKSNTEEKERIN